MSEQNISNLSKNPYPGRGIIIGLTPDSAHYVQVYWIMGRSENSRNRVFVNDNGTVKTSAFDESKMKDPSLIIYNSNRSFGEYHIVSNGDQTDTIYDALNDGTDFLQSLNSRTFEPDAPNFTPRISGLINPVNSGYVYQLSILKALNNNEAACSKQFFNYETGIAGYGHCIHTYATDGNPIPPFEGEPYLVELFNDIKETGEFYWEKLDQDNKVSLVVKFINRSSGEAAYQVINKHVK
ncbi:MAG: inosine monophosphate cyclohydrolase [bacterium]|nr:inosine monophosphate cyclohydrolase [bacterium]